MANSVRIELGAEPLADDVDDIVLERERDTRREVHTDRRAKPQQHAASEFAGRVAIESDRVVVEDIPENEWVEQREHLAGRCQAEREEDESAVLLQIAEENAHAVVAGMKQPQIDA